MFILAYGYMSFIQGSPGSIAWNSRQYSSSRWQLIVACSPHGGQEAKRPTEKGGWLVISLQDYNQWPNLLHDFTVAPSPYSATGWWPSIPNMGLGEHLHKP